MLWSDARYNEGLCLFAEGHWFEAHEVLELLWKEQPQGPEQPQVPAGSLLPGTHRRTAAREHHH